MTLDFDKPIKTRDGRKVLIVSKAGSSYYPIIAIVSNFDGTDEPITYTVDGLQHRDDEGEADLVNVPEETICYYALKVVGAGVRPGIEVGTPQSGREWVAAGEYGWSHTPLKATFVDGRLTAVELV